jgi:hypothetical protein
VTLKLALDHKKEFLGCDQPGKKENIAVKTHSSAVHFHQPYLVSPMLSRTLFLMISAEII